MRRGHEVAVIGAGYVGLTTAVCLAHLGHRARCTDVAARRVQMLSEGDVPMVEEGLAGLLREGLLSGRLTFGTDNKAAVRDAEFVFLCLPTPQGSDGAAEMRYVEEAARGIGAALRPGAVVVNKSTVPVGSTRIVASTLGRPDVAVVSNPEFLREGSAVHDFLFPDRVVIGADDEDVAVRVAALYTGTNAPVVYMTAASAECTKYVANAFLATKLSFVNAVAAFCEAVGADIVEVVQGAGSDRRIGFDFLRPGPGWGGSCLPKDTAALVKMSEDAGYDFHLMKAAIAVNSEQYDRVADKVERLAGGALDNRTVAMLGIAFKAGTDDTRCSPALEVARRLKARGALVKAYDPAATHAHEDLHVCLDPYSACQGASALVVITDWPEFRWLDYQKVADLMENPAILDTRNLLGAPSLRRLGFAYEAIGAL